MEQQETVEEVVEEIVDDNTVDETEESTEEVEGEESTEGEEKPEWMSGDVSVKSHIKMKQKLKGRIAERDTELDKLREEVEALKKPAVKLTALKRPDSYDFDSDDDYTRAMEKYEQDVITARVDRAILKTTEAEHLKVLQEKHSVSIDSHYERAAVLIESSGISSDVFKEADTRFRSEVDSIMPGRGDAVVDSIINILGEGSEKVAFFVGRNNEALDKVKSLLAADPTGMQVAVYLGQQKERLVNPKKRTSTAAKPAPNANGDATENSSGKALKRKYDAAHKKSDFQTAYNAKKAARLAGVEVSSW